MRFLFIGTACAVLSALCGVEARAASPVCIRYQRAGDLNNESRAFEIVSMLDSNRIKLMPIHDSNAPFQIRFEGYAALPYQGIPKTIETPEGTYTKSDSSILYRVEFIIAAGQSMQVRFFAESQDPTQTELSFMQYPFHVIWLKDASDDVVERHEDIGTDRRTTQVSGGDRITFELSRSDVRRLGIAFKVVVEFVTNNETTAPALHIYQGVDFTPAKLEVTSAWLRTWKPQLDN